MVTVIAGFVWASSHQPDVTGGFSSLWAAQGLRETLGAFQGRGPCTQRGRGWQKAVSVAILWDFVWICKYVLEVLLQGLFTKAFPEGLLAWLVVVLL